MTSEALAEVVDKAKAVPEVVDGPKPKTLKMLIEEQVDQFRRALPKHMSAERFTRVVLTAVRTTPKLLECTPESVLGGMMVGAQLGLELNTPAQEAWILPFTNKVKDANGKESWRNEAQFILGYRGIIKLGYQSGQVASIVARSVYRGDFFEYSYGLNPSLVHRPDPEGKGEPYLWYAVVNFTNGGYNFVVANKAEIEKHRARSKAKDGPAWRNDFDPMARKTMIRIVSPYVPQSPELIKAVTYDESTVDIRDVLKGADDPDELDYTPRSIEVTGQIVDEETGEIS